MESTSHGKEGNQQAFDDPKEQQGRSVDKAVHNEARLHVVNEASPDDAKMKQDEMADDDKGHKEHFGKSSFDADTRRPFGPKKTPSPEGGKEHKQSLETKGSFDREAGRKQQGNKEPFVDHEGEPPVGPGNRQPSDIEIRKQPPPLGNKSFDDPKAERPHQGNKDSLDNQKRERHPLRSKDSSDDRKLQPLVKIDSFERKMTNISKGKSKSVRSLWKIAGGGSIGREQTHRMLNGQAFENIGKQPRLREILSQSMNLGLGGGRLLHKQRERLTSEPGQNGRINQWGSRVRLITGTRRSKIVQKIHQFGQTMAVVNRLRGPWQEQEKLGKQLVRFRSIVRLLMMCGRLVRAVSLRHRDDDELTPFIKQLTFRDYDEEELEDMGLAFDPAKFRANKQLRTSEETKRILSKSAEERTERELYRVQIALRNIKSFAEYPVRMQRLIAAHGIYYRYGAKRIVIRQDHRATGFYFILSGSVVVMVMDKENNYARPVAYLSRGMTFGELAIINRSLRQSSIIAKETVELLCITVDDFHRIFMNGNVKDINDPDHNEFINSLAFLRGWPVEIMGEHPDKCIFNYFKEGDVLVKDSNYSNWIYIVKSGSLQVLKKLKKAIPYARKRDTSPRRPEHIEQSMTTKEMKDARELRAQERRLVWSEIKIPKRHPADVFNIDNKKPLPQIKIIRFAPSPNTGETQQTLGRSKGKFLEHVKTVLPKIPEATGRMQGRRLREGDASHVMMESPLPVSAPSTPSSVSRLTPSPTSPRSRRGSNKLQSRKSSLLEDEKEITKEMMGFEQKIRTITDDMDATYNQKKREGLVDEDGDPQYVKMNTLTKGGVFGLSQLFHETQPSFCVVSNGAECILIDKKYYLHHASDDLRQRLRSELSPYPSDHILQNSLQDMINWQAFRHDTVQRALDDIDLRRCSKQQKVL